MSFYPNLYLLIALIPNGWDNKTIIDSTNKICSLPNDSTYYSINPTYSSTDTTSAHTINIKGYNSTIGTFSRVVVAFEDRSIATTDKDYNDVILSVSSVFFDEIKINDTNLS